MESGARLSWHFDISSCFSRRMAAIQALSEGGIKELQDAKTRLSTSLTSALLPRFGFNQQSRRRSDNLYDQNESKYTGFRTFSLGSDGTTTKIRGQCRGRTPHPGSLPDTTFVDSPRYSDVADTELDYLQALQTSEDARPIKRGIGQYEYAIELLKQRLGGRNITVGSTLKQPSDDDNDERCFRSQTREARTGYLTLGPSPNGVFVVDLPFAESPMPRRRFFAKPKANIKDQQNFDENPAIVIHSNKDVIGYLKFSIDMSTAHERLIILVDSVNLRADSLPNSKYISVKTTAKMGEKGDKCFKSKSRRANKGSGRITFIEQYSMDDINICDFYGGSVTFSVFSHKKGIKRKRTCVARAMLELSELKDVRSNVQIDLVIV